MNIQGKAEKAYAHTHRIKHIFVQAFLALSGLYELHAACPNVTVTSSSNQPNLQLQSFALTPQFTDMRIECNTATNELCATSLNVTDSTIVFDTATASEYTNLNNYNFLRSNCSIFPTFDNELMLTSTVITPAIRFGTAVAISGDGSILAIGSSILSLTNFVPRVDIYQRFGNTWISKQFILSPVGIQAKTFAATLSLSWDGSILAIGAPSASTAFSFGTLPPPYPTVFIYERNAKTNQYNLIQSIEGDNLGGFASALQLSATGQYLAVTDDYNRLITFAGNFISPSVWVYTRSITCNSNCTTQATYEFQAKLIMADANGTPLRGFILGSTTPYISQYVAISGDGTTIALGWPSLAISVSPFLISAVAVFKRTGDSWKEVQYITRNQENFGMSVALSSDGSYLAVGEKGLDPTAGDPHHVYIFALHGTQYSQDADLVIPEIYLANNGSSPKVSFSADGTVLAIGTGGNPAVQIAPSSVAIAVRGPNNIWTMPFIRSTPGEAFSLGAGIACSADGAFVIAGAPGFNSLRGAAYIFRPVGSFVPNDTVVTGSLCVYSNTTIDSTLHVQGNIHLNGTIVTGTAGQVTACTTNLSDKRVKTDITPLSHEDIRAQLHALQPVTFDWTLLRSQQAPLFEATESYEGQATSVGFIAQQIEKIFPHWVSTMPAMEEQAQLTDDGQVKMITIKPELYAYLVAALEYLVQKNNARNEELSGIAS